MTIKRKNPLIVIFMSVNYSFIDFENITVVITSVTPNNPHIRKRP